MKRIVFFLMLLVPTVCLADLDEVVLHSENQKCAIRYLTTKPVKGQLIKTNKECPDGWVQGYSSVEIDTPQYQMTETLTGFFMDGYWLGSFPAHGHIQDRSNPQENVQALTYILDTDKEADITYLVQLRATRSENPIYGAFTGCPDFRLLAVVPDIQLFENEVFQEKIATKATLYAKKLCADLDTIAVFGAKKINARAQDIVFQMQIDPVTKEHNIISTENNFQNTDVNEPIELRPQSGEVLLSVEPTEEDFIVRYGKPEKPLPPLKPSKTSPALPLTSLNHLNVQSKLTDHPAQGRVIVHIQNVDLDGSAWVDLPQKVQLKYHPQLKVGWAIIQGRFYKNQMQVSDIQFCEQEWCNDVS